MKICFISTYVPRECGIATYTKDLIGAIKSANSEVVCNVMAMNDGPKYKYSTDVIGEIEQNTTNSYIEAARKINQSDFDVVSLQHEFGIYGGFNGRKILSFLKHVRKPVIMTMHTVPISSNKPFRIKPKRQKSRFLLLKKIFQYVDGITVMTQSSKDYLVTNFNLKSSMIEVIPHGAPEITEKKKAEFRKNKIKMGFDQDDFLITSFGLISCKKGLEYVIEAMPKIIASNPEKSIKYIIAGKPHPGAHKAKERYYLPLIQKMVEKYKIEKNVIFVTKYLELDDIYQYLSISDLYITPYYTKEQASSGTLSFAIGCGCPVISTPYIFAKDLLNNNKVGILLSKFRNSSVITEAVNKLIGDKELLLKYSKNSVDLSHTIFWPIIGNRFISYFQITLDKVK